mgnify:CR=1 FL=1
MMKSYKAYKHELNSFEDIIKKLDFFGVGFLAIVDNDEKLIGIVTDGDIRKALLKNKKYVDEIINTNPLTLNYQTPKAKIISFLQTNKRLHVPLVDENNIFKEVFLLNDFSREYKENHVIIMAGGLGSRLGELTKDVPKPMLQIKGKPILEYIVESFKNQGFNKFIFCVNYKREIIENYFKDGLEFGARGAKNLAEVCERYAALPLLFQSGKSWNYSVATDVVGRIVEIISGQTLDQFFETAILANGTKFGVQTSLTQMQPLDLGRYSCCIYSCFSAYATIVKNPPYCILLRLLVRIPIFRRRSKVFINSMNS